MKLSKTQLFTLQSVAYADKFGRDAYLEVGCYKPHNTNTIKSLERKGLIKIIERSNITGSFYVRLTNEGSKYAAH